MDWTTVITCVMSSITAIVVAAIGLYQKKKAEETVEYRRLREELEKEKQKQLEQEKKEEEQRLTSLENSVNSMKDDMQELTKTNIVHINEQLNHLHVLQSSNMTYIESLSNVVLGIGEILDDSDTVSVNDKKKMAHSIDTHKRTEAELHNKLYNIIV